MGNRRWSKLKKEIESMMDTDLNFQMYCNAYEIGSYGNEIMRYWITIDRKIVWDFPKEFSQDDWYYEDVDISYLIRDYINTNPDDLNNFTELMSKDRFRLIPLLLTCDRRVGKRRLKEMYDRSEFHPYTDIINKRLYRHD